MKKFKYLICLLFVLNIASCTKLDEELFDKIPEDIYPENDAQIANLSVEGYTQLKNYIDDNGWWYLTQEISSDEFCGPTRGSDWYDGGKWVNMHRHEWSNDDEGVNRMWGVFWESITSCNQIIDRLKELPQNEALRKKTSEVEALRSFYYYLLIDNYGDVPYLTSAKGAPDFPTKIPREAVFDSLVKTLTLAIPELKPLNNKYMFTRYAGFALLAKLYLNAEVYTGTPQWELAGQYIDSVLAGPFSMVNDIYSPFATANENNAEIIFSIPFDEDNFQGFRIHMRTLHYQHNLKYNMPVGPWNGLAIVPTHFDRYEDGDERKEGWNIYGEQFDVNGNIIRDGETNQPLIIDPYLPALNMQVPEFTPAQIRMTGARLGKFEIAMGAKENLSNDFPLFRITDFYLMKAETEIRLGRSGDEWINPIRQRAGVSTWSGATLNELLDERARELYMEGHRRQDQIRFGTFGNAWWEKEASGPERETFPIPKWATDANPNLL